VKHTEQRGIWVPLRDRFVFVVFLYVDDVRTSQETPSSATCYRGQLYLNFLLSKVHNNCFLANPSKIAVNLLP
jgi:hypothetical protein